jgi:molecular chaperone DnaK
MVVNGVPMVIPNQWGEHLHASVVHFPGGDRVIVGNEAKRHVILSPDRTIWSAKRILGRKSFSSEARKAKAVCA